MSISGMGISGMGGQFTRDLGCLYNLFLVIYRNHRISHQSHHPPSALLIPKYPSELHS
jgi:hypothetical protein